MKLGVDPTSPDVHLGFAYVLDRLADFQRAGHTIVLIVGDYTARIGDPSGRSKERPVLADAELDANAQYFAEQAFRVLDRDLTEVRFNGEWLGKLSYAGRCRRRRAWPSHSPLNRTLVQVAVEHAEGLLGEVLRVCVQLGVGLVPAAPWNGPTDRRSGRCSRRRSGRSCGRLR